MSDKCMHGTGTYLSSWEMSRVGEAIQSVHSIVNTNDRSSIS